MARSYQKTPGWTNNGRHVHGAKRQANKKVRRNWDIPNGRAYRKVFSPWNIHDFKFLEYGNYWKRLIRDPYLSDQDKLENWYRAWMHK